MTVSRFLAIDFETADDARHSACAIALVGVRGDDVVFRRHYLIRPRDAVFRFTSIHGISAADVARAPTFAELWPRLVPAFAGAHFVAAHNASFDRSVLAACCREAGVAPPPAPFLCTVKLARTAWGLRPATLPAVCNHLGLPLDHHNALSDAEACAQIVVRAGPGYVAGLLAARR